VNTGSFTIGITLVGLLPGDVPRVRIPVANALNQPQGFRDFTCPTAGADARSNCAVVNTEPGLFPLLGGIVAVRLTRVPPVLPPALPAATPVPLLLLPPPPPPPLAVAVVAPLLPPPIPVVVVPEAPVALEVPVIPEADNSHLLLSGLGALGAWAAWRGRLGRSRLRPRAGPATGSANQHP